MISGAGFLSNEINPVSLANDRLLENLSFRNQIPLEQEEKARGLPFGTVLPPVRLEPPALRKAWDKYFAIDTTEANDLNRLQALQRVKAIMRGPHDPEPAGTVDLGVTTPGLGQVAQSGSRSEILAC